MDIGVFSMTPNGRGRTRTERLPITIVGISQEVLAPLLQVPRYIEAQENDFVMVPILAKNAHELMVWDLEQTCLDQVQQCLNLHIY
jgi:hypothetical protein